MRHFPKTKEDIQPFKDMDKYSGPEYYCTAIYFNPTEDNRLFHECPPYCVLHHEKCLDTDIFVEIPAPIAYYARVHAGYTKSGRKQQEEYGKHQIRDSLKKILDI